MALIAGNGQVLWVAIVVAAVLMMRAGLGKRALVIRHRGGPCPSCGRQRSGRVCSWCTRR
jgi:hypothetical protein